MRLNPFVLLVSFVLFAAALTWVLPAGQYERRQDAATGRSVVVPGSFHSVPPAPVGRQPSCPHEGDGVGASSSFSSSSPRRLNHVDRTGALRTA